MKQLFCQSFLVFFMVLTSTLKADLNQDLIECCRKSDLECVKKLISQGADVNTIDMNYYSPLIIAVYKGNFEIANVLIDNGSDICHIDKNNKTAMDYATEQNKQHLLSKYDVCNKINISVLKVSSKLYNERDEALDEQKIEDEKASISFAAYLDYLKEANDKAEKEQTNGGYDASGVAQPYSLASLAPIIAPPPTVKKIAIPTYYEPNRKVNFVDVTIENKTQKQIRSFQVECKAVLDGVTVKKIEKYIILKIDPLEKMLHSVPFDLDPAISEKLKTGKLEIKFNVLSINYNQ